MWFTKLQALSELKVKMPEVRVACVQSNVVFGSPHANAVRIKERYQTLRSELVDVVIFPEAVLTGYCVSSHSAAREIAIPRNHEVICELDQLVQQVGGLMVFGFAERDSEQLFNCAALLEQDNAPRFYRKTHLPHLGLDRFVNPGDELTVFETKFGMLGILICYDQRFPEATRKLVLDGAELIVIPTNWPVGAEVSAEHITIARAAENRVFVASCNRVGTESGFTFIGRSKIISPDGQVLAAAGDSDELLIASLDLSIARDKRRVVIPNEYETDVIGGRRPEIYNS